MKSLLILIITFLFISPVIPSDQKTRVLKPLNSKAKVTITVSGVDRDYYLLKSKTPSVINVRGPGKLKIITRGSFTSEDKKNLNYKIYYKIDGTKTRETEIKNVGRSKAVYKQSSSGIPGEPENIVINLTDGEHSIEVWSGKNNPEIAARYLFTPAKKKKINWTALTPVEPNEPVDLVSQETAVHYFRFSELKPLKIKLTGPTRLKILTRVENHSNMKGRISYRLQVKEDGKIKNNFQLSSLRSETVYYQNEKSKIPGLAKEIILDVPSGMHEYEISPLDKDKGTILGRVLFPKKDVKLGR